MSYAVVPDPSNADSDRPNPLFLNNITAIFLTLTALPQAS